ncbi:MAG: asparagine--tRNA ligase [Cytophagales bacterium]|nr:asparagine--tRNA ligase [Bernardetiaceae bacterium]MDW8210729.1 asparagine--tRNA ligase [Cytophagales bacterium]
MPTHQLIAKVLKNNALNESITVKGWVRTKRANKNVAFIAINDGSSLQSLQIVAEVAKFEDVLRRVTTGACIAVEGLLVPSQGKEQAVEVLANHIAVLGEADPESYPLQKKAHSLEFLREVAHLRMRTNTFGAIFRIRHALSFAVHQYFNDRGFFYLHTPIITASDAEGAGQMFRVTTLDLEHVPKTAEGKVDYTQDFFGRSTNLTVSGQLEAELGALGLGLVYTFGPTFRAENSNTTRHLAEFWMIEPEMAFYDINDNMDLAEDFVKYLISYVLEHCPEDMQFLDERFAKEEATKKAEERSAMGLLQRLHFVTKHSFERITYSQAIEILLNSSYHKKGKFVFPVQWGMDLQSEHERYLVEKHFEKPVIITGYPKEIKAFYMKQNPDGRTVAAMDVLFPGIGEIIGGSQREENLEKLSQRMQEMHVPQDVLWWYLETRKFGTCPHSGFGLGFERMMLFITGMGNIRDVIPFPRTPKNAEF